MSIEIEKPAKSRIHASVESLLSIDPITGRPVAKFPEADPAISLRDLMTQALQHHDIKSDDAVKIERFIDERDGGSVGQDSDAAVALRLMLSRALQNGQITIKHGAEIMKFIDPPE